MWPQVRSLLQMRPADRPTAEGVLTHPWLQPLAIPCTQALDTMILAVEGAVELAAVGVLADAPPLPSASRSPTADAPPATSSSDEDVPSEACNPPASPATAASANATRAPRPPPSASPPSSPSSHTSRTSPASASRTRPAYRRTLGGGDTGAANGGGVAEASVGVATASPQRATFRARLPLTNPYLPISWPITKPRSPLNARTSSGLAWQVKFCPDRWIALGLPLARCPWPPLLAEAGSLEMAARIPRLPLVALGCPWLTRIAILGNPLLTTDRCVSLGLLAAGATRVHRPAAAEHDGGRSAATRAGPH